MAVVIETTIGDFTVDLYTDERPQTCRNFLKLCKLKYYNWNLFHTVQSNFIAQTGDPTGTGKGGESIYGIVLGEKARYYEAEQMPKIKHDRGGLLSMVNCGNNMLGSQFFITLAPHLQSLDGEHCVFGEIAEGLEIILKFNETICDGDHRPYQDIRISHTVILEDPFEDPKGFIVPDMSPEPTREVLMSDRIGADEIIDDTAGMTAEEIAEMQKDKEAKARATILEIVGDIPDAEMAPPENVLFVCKLNPVTNDDDLEIIFSRFGKIIGCEVIRDRQTGDSLQYAFIEFANRKSCEEAYFKMDNVLIDDRRIHVDFSQSVAKMRWRGKGKGIKYFDDKGDNSTTQENSSKEKQGLREKRRDNRHESERQTDDRHNSNVEHRKHEKRKESNRDFSENYGNGGKYLTERRGGKYEDYRREKDRRRRHDREGDKRERSRDKKRSRSRKRSRDKSRDKSRRKELRERSSVEKNRDKAEKTKGDEDSSYKRYMQKKRKSSSSSDSSSSSERSEKEQRHERHEKRKKEKDTDSSDSDSEEIKKRSRKNKGSKRKRKSSSSSSSSSSSTEEDKHKNHNSKKASKQKFRKRKDSSDSNNDDRGHKINKSKEQKRKRERKKKELDSDDSSSEDERQKNKTKERKRQKHEEKMKVETDSSDFESREEKHRNYKKKKTKYQSVEGYEVEGKQKQKRR